MGKRGPKPNGPFEGRTAAFSARLMPSTREMLEKAAKKNGRGISQEIESRLRRSIDEDRAVLEKYGSWDIYGLAQIIAAALNESGEAAMSARIPDPKNNWTGDPWAYQQAVEAVNTILQYFRPDGKIVPPKTPNVKGLPPDLAHVLENAFVNVGPRKAAHIIAQIANEGDVPGVGKKQVTRAGLLRRQLEGGSLLSKIDEMRRKK